MSEGAVRRCALCFSHLETMTDDTGLLQHALYGVPNRPAGYTTDDNARALLVAAQECERSGSTTMQRLAATYLAFLYHAQTPDSFFHNLMSYDRRWIDARGSEDCYGRVLWATGYTATAAVPEGLRRAARQIFEEAVSWAAHLRSPRAIAFSLLGIHCYCRDAPRADLIAGLPETLSGRLLQLHRRYASADWNWFEPVLAYSNAILPSSMLMTYALTGDERCRRVGEGTLEFLTRHTIMDGVLQPIGCHGWYPQDGTRACFDQQPVDVMGAVLLYLNAWRILGEERYRDLASLAFDWFFGRNVLGLPLVNPATGACHDGLMAEGVNGNQGAESQAAYLLAHLAMIRAGLALP